MQTEFEKRNDESSALTADMVKHAIKNNEFLLYYQPIVSLAEQQIKSAEALVRWQHPTLGIIAPDQFMPIAEETGLIVDLSQWIFEVCLQQYAKWQEAGLDMGLAINLSPKIIDNQSTLTVLEDLCKQLQINPANISLELTESAYKQYYNKKNELFHRLRALGFKLAIDDFELRYLNLPELLSLEVDEIKLNKLHILNLDKDEYSQKITKIIINIAKNCGLIVSATGVENLATWNLLEQYKCDQTQGYYICKPVSVPEFNKWIGINN